MRLSVSQSVCLCLSAAGGGGPDADQLLPTVRPFAVSPTLHPALLAVALLTGLEAPGTDVRRAVAQVPPITDGNPTLIVNAAVVVLGPLLSFH